MNQSVGGRLRFAQGLSSVRRAINPATRWIDQRTAFRRQIPIRGRIALFGAAVVATTVVVFSVIVYLLVQTSLNRQLDSGLQRQGDRVMSLIASGRRFPTSVVFPQSDLNTSPVQFLEVVPPQGPPASTGTVRDQPPVVPEALLQSVPPDRGKLATLQLSDGPLTRLYIRSLGPAGYFVVGQPLSGVDDQLQSLRLYLFAAALLSLIGAGVVSWLVAGRALRPLDTMASTAEDIGRTQDLSRRLPETSPTDDEVGRLERSFNQMLRQLEDAYQRLQSALVTQRRFVADASHELRTPLTTIRGNVGLLLKRDDITSDDRAAALTDIAGESERMSRMVQDLLTLARADAGYHLEKTTLDLEPIVQEVSRQAQTLGRRVEHQNGGPAMVEGNPDALRQLLWILVDNAMKHTPEGGRIRMTVDSHNGTTELAVADDGPGIPREDLERIFERFYQADQSRSGEGTGLGLAIARWIAQEHGGRVFANNDPRGGAVFTVQLPSTKVLAKS